MERSSFQKLHLLSNMLLFAILSLFLLGKCPVYGGDLTSLFPRLSCFPDVQPNCDKEFINVYPKLSKSASGMSNATTWFLLYTRKNEDKPELLHKCGGKLPPDSKFNKEKRLIIIIIPFNTAYCDVAVYREWTAQLLEREDANIVVVDYGWGNHNDYGLAVQNAKIVAKQTFVVVRNIQRETGISSNQIYLIGHSLGAQCAGLLGGLWFNKTKTLFARLTALDAAGPGFAKSESLANRLDSTDAKLVDVVHTNAGDCLPDLGINYDAGHVDFYVNGGSIQLSCVKYGFISLIKQDLMYGIGNLVLQTMCFHSQSTQYFKVSINPGDCQFVGVECDSYEDFQSGVCNGCGNDGSKCAIMGYDFEKYYNQTKDHHTYYLTTSLDCPYCDNSPISLEGFTATYKSSLQSS